MMAFIVYLLEVSLSMLALFVIYYVLFRNNTFHQTNRICLLFVILFPFAVPLISVTLPGNRTTAILSVVTAPYAGLADAAPEISQQASNIAGPLPSVVACVYVIGVLFFAYPLLKSLTGLHRIGREASFEPHGTFRIRRTRLKKAFTFLNTIFLPQDETDPIVLQHEQAHVRQLHWFDLLLAEIALIIVWFNPVLRWIRNELRLQHEFLADRAVMSNGVSFEDYSQCLLKNISVEQIAISPTSPLHSNSNKKRIIMMTKEKTSVYKFILYLLLIPASAVLLMSFGKRQQAETAIKQIAPSGDQNIPDVAPVDFEKVTRVVLYGQRKNPAPDQPKTHTGIDFEIPKGSNVYATADGVVALAIYGEKRGNYVLIRHSDVYSTQYSHLTTAIVKKGEKIKKGQVIGQIGNSGLSTAPHLHYEVFRNGAVVDPKDYLPKLPG